MKEIDINSLVRPNILKLKPYSSARMEFQGNASVWLDANENPYGTRYNRYPDPIQTKLRERLAIIKGINQNQLFIGNGSDEVIDLLIRAFCEPGQDSILTFTPSYTMYITSAEINNVDVVEIPLTRSFEIPLEQVKNTITEYTKLIFICTPNNPIGNVVPIELIVDLCKSFNGLVVVDEAYIDFSDSLSAVKVMNAYPNLFILQTLSKAFGMAGLRLGMGIGASKVIDVLMRIKPPYNVSQVTQDLVLEKLNYLPEILSLTQSIKEERERLYQSLMTSSLFYQIFPSEGNFILVQTEKYKELYDYLCKKGIVVRVRNILPVLPQGLRFTVGLPEENTRLINYITQFENQK